MGSISGWQATIKLSYFSDSIWNLHSRSRVGQDLKFNQGWWGVAWEGHESREWERAVRGRMDYFHSAVANKLLPYLWSEAAKRFCCFFEIFGVPLLATDNKTARDVYETNMKVFFFHVLVKSPLPGIIFSRDLMVFDRWERRALRVRIAQGRYHLRGGTMAKSQAIKVN